ncbi:MAG TPA: ribosome small subunit-dependent GTPase A [Thermoanaerobaculales bacterium]|nr:ribosome small subunit-dependent GTPase A [Thermoanaerobaculales bacterium]HPA80303.1 ribosome small subunit-dependent GTPase A [Thermoanaerobaculales bacterium]HQL29093.1 ribosome small subunit-dependent GTPase A [Thermoanaerobaculales bacterium]HQN97209.1 ribosome small subunit-dependent GTPase A [Thermoanaerobaculales bacterium]HQP42597.1 ribosome small subunit-dependent GTPase A [Thermoanaerobaculales bacterium]
MELVDGTVIATHGPLVRVQVGDRTMVMASRRRLDWEGGRPAAARLVVGDRVAVEMKGGDGVVVAVAKRRNSIVRSSPGADRPQVVAANIDQALLVFAARVPEARRGLLDRFLVASHLAGVEAVVVINKVDQGTEDVEGWLPVYEGLGYEVYRVSARTGWGLGRIKRRLAEKTTLFCGPSGAGKSALLNAVYPGFRLKVGSVSEATGKGRHTTTTAELMPLPYGGFVVDTPGLKEFGLWQASREQLAGAFPELAGRVAGCRFGDCSHLQEPGCAVLEAVADGSVDRDRYRSYAKILEETCS